MRRLSKAVFAVAILLMPLVQNSSAATNEPQGSLQPPFLTNHGVINVRLINSEGTNAGIITAKVINAEGSSASFWTGLFGIILGAGIAYFSDWLKELRKRRTEHHGAIVRTQLALISQLNTVDNIRQQFLEQFRKDPDRHLKMIEFEMQGGDLRVAYDSISFLLTTNKSNLVLAVLSAEQSYLAAIEVLASRNEAFHKLHANSQLDAFDPKTGQCMIRPKDPRDISLLKDRTDSLYKAVDTALERLTTQIEELRKAGKSILPKEKFLQIDSHC